jgi:hypothetical protein
MHKTGGKGGEKQSPFIYLTSSYLAQYNQINED